MMTRFTKVSGTALVSAASLVGALALMAGAAQAATEVELKNVAARVIVQPENRSDVELKVAYGKAKVPVIMVHTVDNRLVADGKLGNHNINCRSGDVVGVPGLGDVAKADLPLIIIKVTMVVDNAACGMESIRFRGCTSDP